MMIGVRSCPGCVGDMALEFGPDNPIWVCAQCGNWIPTRPGTVAPELLERDLRFDFALDRDLGGGCVAAPAAIAGSRRERIGWLVMSKPAVWNAPPERSNR